MNQNRVHLINKFARDVFNDLWKKLSDNFRGVISISDTWVETCCSPTNFEVQHHLHIILHMRVADINGYLAKSEDMLIKFVFSETEVKRDTSMRLMTFLKERIMEHHAYKDSTRLSSNPCAEIPLISNDGNTYNLKVNDGDMELVYVQPEKVLLLI